MPKYKLSPEERAAKAARKEKIRELMSEMQIKNIEEKILSRLFFKLCVNTKERHKIKIVDEVCEQ